MPPTSVSDLERSLHFSSMKPFWSHTPEKQHIFATVCLYTNQTVTWPIRLTVILKTKDSQFTVSRIHWKTVVSQKCCKIETSLIQTAY